MHEILQDVSNYVEDERYFGREAFNAAMTMLAEANNDVNKAIIKGTLDCFDVPRINKERDELERRMKARLHFTRMKMQERQSGKPRRTARQSLTFADIKERNK